MRRTSAAVVAFGLLISSGCAVFQRGGNACDYPASASSAFPSTTLEDWVTYGDHAVVMRGVDELDQNGRKVVRLSQERTLWSREQAPAPAPVETFAGIRQSYNAAAAEVDHQYLQVGAWWDDQQDGQPRWVYLELLAFDDGVVGRGSAGCQPGLSDAGSGREAVWERTEAEVSNVLDRTRPDPAAAPFQTLGPDERWQQVAAAR